MPNSTLPGSTYLGNGQRTTAEIQAGLDQVATWLNAAQAELNALTGTTFGEAAVRGVGTGATDLVQTSQLNTRLGTTGDLTETVIYDVAPNFPGNSVTEGSELPSPLPDGLYEVIVSTTSDGGTTYDDNTVVINFRRSDYSSGSENNMRRSAPSIYFYGIQTPGVDLELDYIFTDLGQSIITGDFSFTPRWFTVNIDTTTSTNNGGSAAIRKITKLAATGA